MFLMQQAQESQRMNAHFWTALGFGILWIAGVWTLFKPGMIFGNLGDWIEWAAKIVLGDDRGESFVKPLFRCPACMASVHGTTIWFLSNGSWQWWFPFCVCLCGANYLLFSNLSDE